MKVLITGGSGFLGSHLTDRLLAEGNEVLVLDNYETGRRENLAEQPGLTVMEGTIADRATVDGAFEFGPDVVAHAATSYKDGEAWEHDVMTNAMGTVNVVRASQAAGVGRFIYFQTGLSYGINAKTPTPLDHPQPGESSYAISKTIGERYIALSGLDYVSFRMANIYGPRVQAGPMAVFYKRLSEGKECAVVDSRRDQTYVDDLIDLVMSAIGGTGSGPYNVGSGVDRPVKDMFDLIVAAMGIELDHEVDLVPRPAKDAPTLMLDPTRTTEDFGWTPTTPMEVGVPKTVAWYRKHGVGDQTYTHLNAEEFKVKESG
jgi:UDP-glucose 4-epimerase